MVAGMWVECIGGKVRGWIRPSPGTGDEQEPDEDAHMSKSKDELELEKLVEIDGEFCVPHELNEARHVVDWGPFEPQPAPGISSGRSSCFGLRCACSSLRCR